MRGSPPARASRCPSPTSWWLRSGSIRDDCGRAIWSSRCRHAEHPDACVRNVFRQSRPFRARLFGPHVDERLHQSERQIGGRLVDAGVRDDGLTQGQIVQPQPLPVRPNGSTRAPRNSGCRYRAARFQRPSSSWRPSKSASACRCSAALSAGSHPARAVDDHQRRRHRLTRQCHRMSSLVLKWWYSDGGINYPSCRG